MNSFDIKSIRSFEDVIKLYHNLKTLGYSDEDIVSICGFLHDALNLYLVNSKRLNDTNSIHFNNI